MTSFNPHKHVVYIAGPITKGDRGANVRQALTAANWLVQHEVAPIVPQLSVYWDLSMPPSPDVHDVWLRIDFAFISRCDAVLRLPGESIGADQETEYAYSIGVPVFFDKETLLTYLISKEWLERKGTND